MICISRTKGSKNKVIEVSDTPVKLKTNIEEIKAALEREGWTVLIFRHGEGKVSDWANQVQEALKF